MARNRQRAKERQARRKAEREAREKVERAEENAALLRKTVLTISQQAGEDGRLFGSVTSQEIAKAIKQARGIKVDKRNIFIDEAIKTSRSLTAELSPPILHQSGLIAGLKWLAQWMHDKYGFDVRLEIHDENSGLSDKVSTFLFHAIRELLSNVRKHAGVKAAGITISSHDESVWITVADEGCGFDTNQIRSGGGTAGGFGLFMLSERLSMLGGRMKVESAPRAGSKITLVLPQALAVEPGRDLASSRASRAPRFRSRQAGSIRKAKKKIRILLVDDHAVVRHGLAVMLQEHEQLEVAGEASDGESAIEMVRRLHPDVVLMDISMPGMNGIQATRIIHSEFPEISVIGLSMFQEKEQATAMMEAGAVNYLSKSGPPDDVITAINACAGKRH